MCGRRSGGLSDGITWGVGLCIGWYIGGLILAAVAGVCGLLWAVTGAMNPDAKTISRTILIVLAVALLLLILLLAGGNA